MFKFKNRYRDVLFEYLAREYDRDFNKTDWDFDGMLKKSANFRNSVKSFIENIQTALNSYKSSLSNIIDNLLKGNNYDKYVSNEYINGQWTSKNMKNAKTFTFYDIDVNHDKKGDYIKRSFKLRSGIYKDSDASLVYVLPLIRDFFNNNFIYSKVLKMELKGVNDDPSNLASNVIVKVLEMFEELFQRKDIANVLDRIDSYKRVLDYVFDETRDLYVEMFCRGKASKMICEIRRNEGVMINSSLADVRNVIKNVIAEKNKSTINLVPPFMNECLPFYCLSGSCFPLGDKVETKSIIFEKLRTELGNLDKLVLAVFCVFNISYGANNPPPVPYIDINKLKGKVDRYKSTGLGQSDIVIESRKVIKKIEVDLADKTHELRSMSKYVDDFLPTVLWDDAMAKNDTLLMTLAPTDKFFNLIANTESMISSIDKFNAASAIGTLEFVDSLAKYISTNIVCQPNRILSRSSDTWMTHNEFKDVLEVIAPIKSKVGGNLHKVKKSSMKKQKK
jgi:hypothetical protein